MQFEKKNVFSFVVMQLTETNCLYVREDTWATNPIMIHYFPERYPERRVAFCFLFYCEKREWRLLVLLQAPDASNRMIHAQQQRCYYNDLDIKMRPGIFVLENKKAYI